MRPGIPFTPLAFFAAISLACCSTIGGRIASGKKRGPVEGPNLGSLVSPIGVAVEARFPTSSRPRWAKTPGIPSGR